MLRIREIDAFSLAECLISILLLALTLVASLSFFFNASHFSASDQHRREAMELADSRMESYRAMGYSNVANNSWNDQVGSLSVTDTATVNTVTLNSVNYKQVQVLLNWQEAAETASAQQQNQSINLVTYIAQ
jgi:type II secretory pathway pseudopilin PulG